MFRAKTVLVVGAGASGELGFPLGDGLLKAIAQMVDISYHFGQQERGDHILAQALRSRLGASTDITAYNDHLHAAWQIVKSSKQGISIDNVLDALENEKASLVGKFGIVRQILESERSSPISSWSPERLDQIDISKLENTWLNKLTKILTEGVQKSKIDQIFDNLTIVNFNYDRNIEHFLPFAIADYYGVPHSDVCQIFKGLKIFRPYGKAGVLPWEDGNGKVPYGDCNARSIEIAAQDILTFTEQVSDQNTISGIRNSISTCEKLVFLGFGFHRQNLAFFQCSAKSNLKVHATSFGMSAQDCQSVLEEIESLLELDKISVQNGYRFTELSPQKCNQFMLDNWRTITSYPATDPTFDIVSA